MSNLKPPPNYLYYVVYIDISDSFNNYEGLLIDAVYSDLKLCWPALRALRADGHPAWIGKVETPYGDDIAEAAAERGLE